MIRITAAGVVRDGCMEEFRKLAERLVVASRAEAGNLSYGLYAVSYTHLTLPTNSRV